jgi:DNA-binding NarL/FixJ family response regulator
MFDLTAPTTREPARILIVDDHPVVREGLAIRISREDDLKVCAEASCVTEALAQVDATDPDAAIIDISLGDGDGIDLIRRFRARAARARLLVWSMYPETLYAERALSAGAMGYINKQEATIRIIEAIRCILDGRPYLSQSMSDRLLLRTFTAGKTALASPVALLSDRELEVFRAIGKGLSTSEIAAMMNRSVHTVETYRQRIKIKLNLQTSAELARSAAHFVLENG